MMFTAGCANTSDKIGTSSYSKGVTKHTAGYVIRSDEFAIVNTGTSDTFESLAKEFLGTESRAWEIKSFNQTDTISADQEIVIPLKPLYPLGIYPNGYQTIPILCYHRFGLSEAKMTVTPESFAKQMAYLAKNDYKVIPLKELIPFLNGERELPPKSVILTFDDGYKSFYLFAYPIMLKYKFPGTVFVYSEFIGTPDGLDWDEMNDMTSSGLIDIQPHSFTHSNLGISQLEESHSDYIKRIRDEIIVPKKRLQQHLKRPIHSFAYPYGDTNENVIKKLKSQEYRLGLTVEPGSNPAFSSPFMLRRTMVFGSDDIRKFQKDLTSFNEMKLR